MARGSRGTGGTGNSSTDQLKKQNEALTIAIQLLTTKIDTLASGNQPFRNMEGMGEDGSKKSSAQPATTLKDVRGAADTASGGMMGLVVGKLVAVLAPIAILAAAIASNVSGFQVFLNSAKLLGTVLGAMLLPFFLALGAAVYLLADYIESQLMNNLEEWYQTIIDEVIPALEDFADWLVKAYTAIKDFVKDTIQAAKNINEGTRQFLKESAQKSEKGEGFKAGDVPVLGEILRGWEQTLKKKAGEMPPEELIPGFHKKLSPEEKTKQEFMGPPVPTEEQSKGYVRTPDKEVVGPQLPSSRDKAIEALHATIQEFKISISPQAQRSGLAEVQKQAQMAALQTSPFQAKILEITSGVLNAINKVDQHLPGPSTTF